MAEGEGIISSVAVKLRLETAEMENRINNTMVEFKRLGSQISGISGSLGGIGLAGSGAFAALLGFMPGVSRELGLVNLDMMDLGRSLEDNIEPKVRFLREAFGDLVNIVERNEWMQEMISWIVTVAPLLAAAAITIKLLGLAFGLITSPIGIIIAGIATLSVVIPEIITTFEELTQNLIDLDKRLNYESWTDNLLVDFLLLAKRGLEDLAIGIDNAFSHFSGWDDLTFENIILALTDVRDTIQKIVDLQDSFSEAHPIFSLIANPKGAIEKNVKSVLNSIVVNITTGDLTGDSDVESLADIVAGKLADMYSSDGGTTA